MRILGGEMEAAKSLVPILSVEELLQQLRDGQILSASLLDRISPDETDLLIDSLATIPPHPKVVLTVMNVQGLAERAWQRLDGGAFFTRGPRVTDSPHHLALMLMALNLNPAWQRAHERLVAGYLINAMLLGHISDRMWEAVHRTRNYSAFEPTFLACVPNAFETRVNNLEVLQNIRKRRASTSNTEAITEAEALLAAVATRREELFATHWLPAAIPADEYAQVRHLPTSMLVSLYATQYEGGYPLYHATLYPPLADAES